MIQYSLFPSVSKGGAAGYLKIFTATTPDRAARICAICLLKCKKQSVQQKSNFISFDKLQDRLISFTDLTVFLGPILLKGAYSEFTMYHVN